MEPYFSGYFVWYDFGCWQNLKVYEGHYQQGDQWMSHAPLGSGAHAECFLATDMTTRFRFCIKLVNIRSHFINRATKQGQNVRDVKMAKKNNLKLPTLIFCMTFVVTITLIMIKNQNRGLLIWGISGQRIL